MPVPSFDEAAGHFTEVARGRRRAEPRIVGMHVWRTTFLDGPIAGSVHRMIEMPPRWAVYMHRQAEGIVRIESVDDRPLQDEFWEQFVYELVDAGVDDAGYRLVAS